MRSRTAHRSAVQIREGRKPRHAPMRDPFVLSLSKDERVQRAACEMLECEAEAPAGSNRILVLV
jgi:hypothetical protein